MSTAVISGRVDTMVQRMAEPYIKRAGLNPGDVIRITWENIAATGELPRPVEQEEKKEPSAFEKFMAFCSELPPCPELATMTDEEMKDLIASRYE